MADEQDAREGGLIPIETIDPQDAQNDGPFVPRVLSDDPDTGDGSSGRAGVPISKWRLHTLDFDRLGSVSEPSGRDRYSRKARRFHRASRRARTEHGRVSRRRRRVIVAFLVVLLISSVAVACVTYALELWGGKTIPNVLGLSQGLATEQLGQKGFSVDVQSVTSDNIEGHVVSVSPNPGERVPTSQTVRIEVSQSRKVPKVVGKSRDEARKALKEAGATNVRLELREDSGERDTVLEVKPSEDSVFMSSDEITLIVSELPAMPDVLGKDRQTALGMLNSDGIPVTWDFERADAEHRLLVVRTEPSAGGRVPKEGATVYLGDPLVDVARLADYFDSTTPHVIEFLQDEGFSPKSGRRRDDGHVAASFIDSMGRMVSFAVDPWSHAIELDQGAFEHVVDDAMRIEGVRISVPLSELEELAGSAASATSQEDANSATNGTATASQEPAAEDELAANEATARLVMEYCGFADPQGSCTQDSITLPDGTKRPTRPFYCCHGQSGDRVWTVLLRNSLQDEQEALEAVATCAPKTVYEALDLSASGNSICDYVAYQDEVLR